MSINTFAGKIKTVPRAALIEKIEDRNNCFHFVVETKAATVFTVTPKKFKIFRGHQYFIDNTYGETAHLEPTAVSDGRIQFKLPKMYRAGIAISEIKRPSLLFNGSFEKSSSWKSKVYNQEKADKYISFKIPASPVPKQEKISKDIMRYSSKFHRTGGRSWMMEKNSEKTLLKTSSAPIELTAGKTYYFTGFYYPQKFTTETTFSRNLRLYVDGKKVKSITDRSIISLPPHYTEPGKWRYTFDKIAVPSKYKGKKIRLVVSLEMDGARGRVFWDDLKIYELPALAKLPGKEIYYEDVLSSEQLDSKLRKMRSAEAKLARFNNQTFLKINDKIVPALIYCINSANKAYHSVTSARKQGINIIVIKGNLNYWCIRKKSVWQGKDKYKLSIIRDNIRKTLLKHPNAKVILRLEMIYNDFYKDYPESKWISKRGKTDIKLLGTSPGIKVSHISDAVRNELQKAYSTIGRYLKSIPEGKPVVGLHITFGDDGQWYPDRPWTFKTFDYSEGTRRGLIKELKAMYGNDIVKLREKWQEKNLNFADIKIPPAKDFAPDKFFMTVEPGKGRKLYDIITAYHHAVIKTMNLASEAFKKGIGKPVISMTYLPDNCIITKDYFLHNSKLDAIVSVPGYLRKRTPGGHCSSYHPLGSFRLHNKLFLAEIDFRGEYGASKSRFYRRYVGMSTGVKEHFNQIRRNFAYLFSQGAWGWFMTIGYKGHFVWHNEFSPILGEIQRAGESLLKAKAGKIIPQVNVFNDDLSQIYFSEYDRRDHSLNHTSITMRGLHYSGLSWTTYLQSDLMSQQKPDAKISLFTNATGLNKKQIIWIQKNLQKNGNILIFANDAGRIAPGGFSKNIKRLTGINIQVYENEMVNYCYNSKQYNEPLSCSSYARGLWYKNQKGPLYLVKDKTVGTIATLKGTNLPGIVVKRHKNWTAIYIAGSIERAMTPKLWRKISVESGITPIGPEGDLTYAGNGIVAIHAVTPGEKTLKWGFKADILDLTSNICVGKNSDSITFEMEFGETRWFKLTK